MRECRRTNKTIARIHPHQRRPRTLSARADALSLGLLPTSSRSHKHLAVHTPSLDQHTTRVQTASDADIISCRAVSHLDADGLGGGSAARLADVGAELLVGVLGLLGGGRDTGACSHARALSASGLEHALSRSRSWGVWEEQREKGRERKRKAV